MALNRALQSLGQQTHPEDRVRTFIGDGSWILSRRALGGDPPKEQVDRLYSRFLEEYGEAWREGTTIYPGLTSMLHDLQDEGLPLAVLSNKPHRFTSEMVKALFRPGLFRVVRGEGPETPRKPDPLGATTIAEALDLAPAEIAMVGDSTVDHETAVAAGMQPILVTWGFHDVERLTRTGAPLLHSAEALHKCLQALHRGA